MLNITAQRNANGAKSYFAKSDYYASVDDHEIVGDWGGRAARLLGLSGQVEKQAFDALCDNLHPSTGAPITRITRDGRRVGYDFTWSAPKSVSVIQALSGDSAIIDAWRSSVRETMEEMEAEMQTRVRKNGKDSDRTTGNWVWAEFVHKTARPVNKIPSPQLHSHCFVQNVTFDAIEGQWKAGQFGGIKNEAYYWQAVQQARFAHKLEALGYSTRPTKDAFEITGVPHSVIQKFSQRTSVIEKVAAKLGITDPKRKAGLAATTRENKNDSLSYGALREVWKSWLSDAESEALRGVTDSVSPKTPAIDNSRHAKYALDHTFERTSIAEKRRVLTLALKHGVGQVTPEGVRADLAGRDLLVRQRDGVDWITTKHVLAEERRMFSFANVGKGVCEPLGGGHAVRVKDSRLDSGQLNAVLHILDSFDRVMLIVGDAGTGKTTLAREAVSQIEDRGKSVVMLAPSAQASRGVLRDQEGFKDADTLARFLIDVPMQANAKDGVIWLDEAGLVSTQDMSRLFELADELNARVIAVGDHKQMSSVGRGAAFRALQDVARLPAAEVKDIKRQTVPAYRAAVRLLAAGKTGEGFDRLNELGWVNTLPVWDRYKPVAETYSDRIRSKQDCLIVCPTHAEAALITAQVRERLKADRLLGGDERQVKRLVPMQWTEAERGDVGRYSGEEVLRFHRNIGRFKAGDQIKAANVLGDLGRINPKYFSTFADESVALATGEVVRVVFNCKSKDGKHQLNNGASYRVDGFTSKGDILLNNGWVLDQNAGALAHGYTATAHAAQGRSTDHLILVQTSISQPAASEAAFYVAVSRGKKSAAIFTDDRRSLREAVVRRQPKVTATELLAIKQPSFFHRLRRTIERVEQAAWWRLHSAASQLHRQVKPKELQYER